MLQKMILNHSLLIKQPYPQNVLHKSVLCPWVCTEYTNCYGIVSLEIMLRIFLPKCLIQFISPKPSF